MNREFLILSLGRIVQMLVLVFTFRVMTAQLSPSEVGVVGLLTAVGTVYIWLLTAPVAGYVSRHTFGWWLEKRIWPNYLRYSAYVLGISILAIPLTYIWSLWAGPNWRLTRLWPFLIALYILFSVLGPTLVTTLNVLNRRIAFVFFSSVQQIALLGCAWTATAFDKTGIMWFTGQTAGYAATGLIAFAVFASAISQPSPDARPARKLSLKAQLEDVLRFSGPLVLNGIFYWLQFQGYRVVISQLTGLNFLGLFFAGYSVSAAVLAAVDAVAGQFITPYFYKHIEQATEERRFDLWGGYVGTMYPLIAVLAASLIALQVPISHLLLAPKFWSASIYIGIGAVVESCRYMASYYNLAAQISKRTILQVAPQAISAIVMLVVTVIGVKMFGEKAIGPSLVLAGLVLLVAVHLIMVPHSGTRLIVSAWRPAVLAVAALTALFVILQYIKLAGFWEVGEFLAVGGVITLAACLYIIRMARDALVGHAT